MNKTQDLKAIAELQARINIENAQLQNVATQLIIYDKIAASEQKIVNSKIELLLLIEFYREHNKGHFNA
ncbi:type IV secretion system protein [Snodgrassella alvi]|uniref:type IV secretion system protein n=1 Tax=Snodgrassella alvi TaxID=1196083 RepID=UPI003B3B2712